MQPEHRTQGIEHTMKMNTRIVENFFIRDIPSSLCVLSEEKGKSDAHDNKRSQRHIPKHPSSARKKRPAGLNGQIKSFLGGNENFFTVLGLDGSENVTLPINESGNPGIRRAHNRNAVLDGAELRGLKMLIRRGSPAEPG